MQRSQVHHLLEQICTRTSQLSHPQRESSRHETDLPATTHQSARISQALHRLALSPHAPPLSRVVSSPSLPLNPRD